MDFASRPAIDSAFESIEADILPRLALVLESLLDVSATPEAGNEGVATELRILALQLEDVTRTVEALGPAAAPDYRAASA
jgi:hypothetical protein